MLKFWLNNYLFEPCNLRDSRRFRKLFYMSSFLLSKRRSVFKHQNTCVIQVVNNALHKFGQNTLLKLPTTKEGNVFRSVCLFNGGGEGCHLLSGTMFLSGGVCSHGGVWSCREGEWVRPVYKVHRSHIQRLVATTAGVSTLPIGIHFLYNSCDFMAEIPLNLAETDTDRIFNDCLLSPSP